MVPSTFLLSLLPLLHRRALATNRLVGLVQCQSGAYSYPDYHFLVHLELIASHAFMTDAINMTAASST